MTETLHGQGTYELKFVEGLLRLKRHDGVRKEDGALGQGRRIEWMDKKTSPSSQAVRKRTKDASDLI